jgi:exonuclease III
MREDNEGVPPPLPHSSLHLIPNPRVTSWNTNSLSVYGTSESSKLRRGNIYDNLRQLKRISDILCLQEPHLKEGDQLAARSVFGNKCSYFYNNANGRKDTMIIVSSMITDNFIIHDVTPEDVPLGRLQALHFVPKSNEFALKPFLVLNCYLPTGGQALSSRRIALFDNMLRIPTCDHTIMVGDFNFVETKEDTAGPNGSFLSKEAGIAWRRMLDRHRLQEVHQPLMTFFRAFSDLNTATSASRLDRIYVSHSDADQSILTPTAYVPNCKHTPMSYNAWKLKLGASAAKFRASSDHFAVHLRFVPTAPSKKRDFNIPKWVGDTPDFVTHFKENWDERRIYDTSFLADLALKKQMVASAKKVLKKPKLANYDKVTHLTRAITLFRLATQGDGNPDRCAKLVESDDLLSKCYGTGGNYDEFYSRITAHISIILEGCVPSKGIDNGGPAIARPSATTNIIQDVKMELPSSRKRLVQLREEGREPETCPKLIAKIIKKFWKDIWSKRPDSPSPSELEAYLERYAKEIPPDAMPELPTLLHFHAALEDTNNSSAGHDGIPFSCYRALRVYAAPILFEVFFSLAKGAHPPRGFNFGRLHIIPKDSSYRVDCTRPINVNNSSNRIITSVVVVVITPTMQVFLEPAQKGFVEGRIGTEHVEDLNKVFYEAMRDKVDVYVIFLDTKKAFDSIDHAFIELVMYKVGFPQWCITFTMSLFKDVLVFPVTSERTNTSIEIHRGVKQGCPLSPLLFALVYDVLLFFLGIEGIVHKFAFADDLAAAVYERELAQAAMVVIDAFARFSGLGLNSDKTVILKSKNFSTSDVDFFKNSSWPDVVLGETQKYLGVLFGRGVDSFMVYEAALEKFYNRLDSYRQTILSRSIDHRILIINVFLTSIFSYLIHFFIIPRSEVVMKVRDAIRKVVIAFNGGGFAYVHLVTPTRYMGFKQPLRDLWAAGITALCSHVDMTAFNGRPHPPLNPSKTYLDTANGWASMLIEDHRDAAALDLLSYDTARSFDGMVQVEYKGKLATKKMYDDAICAEYRDEVLSPTLKTSLSSRLRIRWNLQDSGFAMDLRENAANIGKWVPAHYRSNQIKLMLNALATDDKRERMGGRGPSHRRALGFPCYLCGEERDAAQHVYACCPVTESARHFFLYAIGYENVMKVTESLPVEAYVTGCFPANEVPPLFFSAMIVFNQAVWEYTGLYFKALRAPPSIQVGSKRIARYAITLWDLCAPKRSRSIPLRRAGGFAPPLPVNRAPPAPPVAAEAGAAPAVPNTDPEAPLPPAPG